MKIHTEKVIDCSQWDKFVTETYGRPYKFQQQEGCKPRGYFRFTVPSESDESEMHDSIPEKINGAIMGVKFAAWLARDPKQHLNDPEEERRTDQWGIDLWWDRNFYPNFQTLANDLHSKGLIDAGAYTIDIDW
jgi:hypothetical protein